MEALNGLWHPCKGRLYVGPAGEGPSELSPPASPYVHLLEYLVRQHEKARGDREPKGLSGFEINGQMVFCRLLDGDVGGLGASQNLVYQDCDTVEPLAVVWPI
jgi:hypothetical protein